MKLLLALSALLVTALCAFAFPAMNKFLLVVPVCLSVLALLFASGCSTSTIERDLRKLPDGHFDSVTLSNSNLGIGSAFEATSLTKAGNDITFQEISATHNDPWTGTTKLELKGGGLNVGATSRAKKPAPSAPTVTVSVPGSGYNAAPSVTITGGGGNGATAHVAITPPDELPPATATLAPAPVSPAPASSAAALPAFDAKVEPISVEKFKAH